MLIFHSKYDSSLMGSTTQRFSRNTAYLQVSMLYILLTQMFHDETQLKLGDP
jgi:hypothetical protein